MNTLAVLIPTYKRAQLLDKCLKSIVDSELPIFNIIIGDDGGDIETKQVIDKYAIIFSIIHLKPEGKGSLATNISRIFKANTADWILFLHDDDFLCGNHAQLFSKISSQYDFSFTDHFIADEDGVINNALTDANTLKYGRHSLKNGIQDNVMDLVLNQRICLDGFYIKSSMVNVLPNNNFGQVADFFWIFQLLTQNDIKVGYLSIRSFAYVLSSVGLTANGGRLNEDIILGYNYLKSLDKYKEYNDVFDRIINYNTWFAVNAANRRNDGAKAFNYLKDIKFIYKGSLKRQLLLPVQLLIILKNKFANYGSNFS